MPTTLIQFLTHIGRLTYPDGPTRLSEHAALVRESEWAHHLTHKRETMAHPTPAVIQRAGGWDAWRDTRSALLAEADPISRRWLTALMHVPGTEGDVFRNLLDFAHPQQGGNVIRNISALAETITQLSDEDLAAQWDSPTSGEDASRRIGDIGHVGPVGAWLVLMSLIWLPIREGRTTCTIGNRGRAVVLLPHAPLEHLEEAITKADSWMQERCDLLRPRWRVGWWEIHSRKSGPIVKRFIWETDEPTAELILSDIMA